MLWCAQAKMIEKKEPWKEKVPNTIKLSYVNVFDLKRCVIKGLHYYNQDTDKQSKCLIYIVGDS